jgi:hypothetical protein
MRAAPAERHQAEHQLLNEGWHVVRLVKVTGDFGWRYHDMMKWCIDIVGPGRMEPGHHWLDGHDVWYAFNWFGYYNFHFKHAKDATAFSLRWV